jgi:hypothetical protein
LVVTFGTWKLRSAAFDQGHDRLLRKAGSW